MDDKRVQDQKKNRIYAAIDLKSFYASVECVDRGRDPLTTNLVVADESRTAKTICLAVSPSLKEFGIPGRARLFEVIAAVEKVNAARKMNAPGGELTSYSDYAPDLADPSVGVEYIVAPPQMANYMRVSGIIFDIYLRYVSNEDIFTYSVDEVFIDLTDYLKLYKMSPRDLVIKMVKEVLNETGITATAGIGTNMYLAKVAMDIVAKHAKADEDGVRIAELDEMSYRRQLWTHTPITDFWMVGRGYERKLVSHGLGTMGDIAMISERDEDILYGLFGVNAELLIDHAWGYEPTTIADVKAYKPVSNSLSSGQVLQRPYRADEAEIIVREMADLMVLDLVKKGLMTDKIVLTIGYDRENLDDKYKREDYGGEITKDHYNRAVPKHAHGTANLGFYSSSSRTIISKTMELFDRIIDKKLSVRRVTIVADDILPERVAMEQKKVEGNTEEFKQLSFADVFENGEIEEEKKQELQREKRLQKAILSVKDRYGKNALVKGTNMQEAATGMERNAQVGGHKA